MDSAQKIREDDSPRITRLLRIAQEIRREPHQTQEHLWQKFGISRSQYYKDKAALAEVGFLFDFQKNRGFRILEDRLTPITGLTFSDRLLLMFALEHLAAEGDGTLAALAMETGRKLAGGLDSPSGNSFRKVSTPASRKAPSASGPRCSPRFRKPSRRAAASAFCTPEPRTGPEAGGK